MAPKLPVLLLAAVVVAASWSAASAQSCTATIIGLAPCLGFIQGTASTPSSSCCSQLASVVQSQPRCLCQVLNGGSAPFGITVNRTQALALPGACSVQTPSPALCNSVAGGPAATPAPAPSSPPTAAAPPAPSPPSTPSTPSPPSTPSTPSPPSSTPMTPPTPSTPTTSTSAPPSPAAPATPSIPSSAAGSSNRVALSIFFALLFSVSVA